AIGRDVRYGLRSLRRSRGLVAAGVSALALGIGLTTVMFSIIYGTFIRGLPYPGASRIVMVYHADQERTFAPTASPYYDFTRYRAAQRAFETFGAYDIGTVTVTGGDHPERLAVANVTAGTLDVTSIRPILGRTFT